MTFLRRNLAQDVHLALSPPDIVEKIELVRGKYEYWHYGCDNTDDRGWGCGYRTLQTLSSWVLNNISDDSTVRFRDVPSLQKIQEILFDMEDKPSTFVGSREWIGSFEICLVLDYLYDISSKIINISSGTRLSAHLPEVLDHFRRWGSPIMMGGDIDASSKGIFGACVTKQNDAYLLVVDPHYWSKQSVFENDQIFRQKLVDQCWVKWRNLKSFSEASFYNLCLPQVKCCL